MDLLHESSGLFVILCYSNRRYGNGHYDKTHGY